MRASHRASHPDPGVAQPVFYSANGISGGGTTVYGAYAVKNANGARFATVVLQNVGAAPVSPTIAFTPFGGGAQTTFTGPAVAAGCTMLTPLCSGWRAEPDGWPSGLRHRS